MPLLRRDTFDAAIWSGVAHEYPAVPTRFAPGDLVLDVGCHTGAFCALAAERGARVLGYEASRANYGLACINTAPWPDVRIRWGAVWRSDRPPGRLRLVPFPDARNTGGASVMFASGERYRRHAELGGFHRDAGGPVATGAPAEHEVPAVPLDAVLDEVGAVRLLKIDAEGAEYPILATARRLAQVDMIVGEYHEFSREQLDLIAAEARVPLDRYDGPSLAALLEDAGFGVIMAPPAEGHGLFAAARHRAPRPWPDTSPSPRSSA
jgi:FkbM family methyltransferase